MSELKPWKPAGTRTLYQRERAVFREDLLELPGGQEGRYPVLHLGGSAGVVPRTADGEVILLTKLAILRAALAAHMPGSLSSGPPAARAEER